MRLKPDFNDADNGEEEVDDDDEDEPEKSCQRDNIDVVGIFKTRVRNRAKKSGRRQLQKKSRNGNAKFYKNTDRTF